MRRLALLVVLVLVGGGVLGACDAATDDDDQADELREASDDETDDEETDDGEQTDDEEETDDGGGGGEDQELAEDIVLTLDDLPEGFAETDDDEETDDDGDLSASDEEFTECAGDELVEQLEDIEGGGEGGGSAESPDFESADQFQFVGSAAFVGPDEELAGVLFDLFAGECFSDAIVTGFEEDEGGSEFTDVVVEPIDDLPELGDETAGFAIEATADDPEGISIEISFELAVIRTGRAVAFALVGGVFEPFPTSDRDELLEAMAERMEPAA